VQYKSVVAVTGVAATVTVGNNETARGIEGMTAARVQHSTTTANKLTPRDQPVTSSGISVGPQESRSAHGSTAQCTTAHQPRMVVRYSTVPQSSAPPAHNKSRQHPKVRPAQNETHQNKLNDADEHLEKKTPLSTGMGVVKL
jgi:hypothetical protein